MAIGRLIPKVIAHKLPSISNEKIRFLGIMLNALRVVMTVAGPAITKNGMIALVIIVCINAFLPTTCDFPYSCPVWSFTVTPYSSSLYLIKPTLAMFARDTANQLKIVLAINCFGPVILDVMPEKSLFRPSAILIEVTTAPE